MKIGIAQLNSSDSIEENLAVIKKIILSFSSDKPKILFFPENSLYFRVNSNSKVQALSLEDSAIVELEQLCSQQAVAIHLTTAILDQSRVYNATVFIEPHKKARIIYRKIHLFDIELIGQKPIRESDVFANGEGTFVLDYEGFKFGNSICYDVRFSELYSQYAKAQVDVIVIPAAFLVKTGQAHWEVLLRARAIESQCYVVASAQSGVHRSQDGQHQRETYGHSMIIDPWGQVQEVKASDVGVILAEIKHDEIHKVRQQIPMSFHRRIDF